MRGACWGFGRSFGAGWGGSSRGVRSGSGGGFVQRFLLRDGALFGSMKEKKRSGERKKECAQYFAGAVRARVYFVCAQRRYGCSLDVIVVLASLCSWNKRDRLGRGAGYRMLTVQLCFLKRGTVCFLLIFFL